MTTSEPLERRVPDGDADAGVKEEANASDVVEGPVGGASLREPSEIEADGAGADLASLPDIDDGVGSRSDES